MVPALLPFDTTPPIPPASSAPQLITAVVLGIVVLIALVAWLKLHPFLALTLAAVSPG